MKELEDGMKRIWLTRAVAVALACGMTTAAAQEPTQSEREPAQRTGAAQERQTGPAEDKDVAEKMYMVNMAEIELGRLAVERAASAEVKSFAQMMIEHHTKANQELEPIAQQLGVERPEQLDAKHRALADRLSTLEGAEFDKAYMRAMVQGHQEVADHVKLVVSGSTTAGAPGASSTTGSATAGSSSTAGSTAPGTAVGTTGTEPRTVEQYAAKTLPTVQQHLQQARQIESGLDK